MLLSNIFSRQNGIVFQKVDGTQFAREDGVETRSGFSSPSPMDRRSIVTDTQFTRRFYIGQKLKRCFDIVSASLLLLVTFPVFFVLWWCAKRDGGPAFFQHIRIGRGGRSFGCYKFRSMVMDSDRVLKRLLETDPTAAREWAATQKLQKDPRITPVGRLLRKTSLDELPQLLNVIKGEMSLVGPRPVVRSELEYYGGNVKYYEAVRPGITGLWQISGRSDTTYAERVALDTEYVQKWTLRRDVMILLKTIPAVLAQKGAR